MPVYPSYAILKQARSSWAPADQGLKLQSFDHPAFGTASTATADGRVYLAAMYTCYSMTISTAHAYCSAAGTSVTVGHFGIYSFAGIRLGNTANQTTAFQSTGLKSIALSASVAIPPGYYWGAILTTSTTDPQWRRAPNTTALEVNAGLASASSRAAWLSSTGNTDLPASFTPGTGFAATPPALFWIAFS